MQERSSAKIFRQRRTVAVLLTVVVFLILQAFLYLNSETTNNSINEVLSISENSMPADLALEKLITKGRSPKTGYSRSKFGEGWSRVQDCDLRNIILKRYLTNINISEDGCIVLSGVLNDNYSGQKIEFTRGEKSSGIVQIDHVVALSDAWQKGAQLLSDNQRVMFANDPLNLLPVSGQLNIQKGDSDAASWLPPNKSFRCAYVARQIAVKAKYNLWVTPAERSAIKRVLNGCGEQVLPVESHQKNQ